jgi:DNA-binding XRE family transcriptional regulator
MKAGDLDSYITERKESDPCFSAGFDTGYDDFKFGVVLKALRESSGMTQDELAKRLNTKKSVISRMENHSADARLSTIRRVAAVFGKKVQIVLH